MLISESSGGITSGGITSGGITSGGITSGGITSGGITSGGITSGGIIQPGGIVAAETPPVAYMVLCEDYTVVSASNGTVQTYVVTPKQYWGLGLNLSSFLAGLRIKGSTDPNAGAGVTLKWQYSLDGKTWKTGSTVIAQQSNPDDYSGTHSVLSEQTPFVRLIAEVKDPGGSVQKSASITAWGYYRYGK